MKDLIPVTADRGAVLGGVALAPAEIDDVSSIARVWHAAWNDGHLGHVPVSMLEYRTLAEFTRRAADRVDDTTIACAVTTDGATAREVLGFVTVRGDEVEQLFVDAPFRGSGVATRLLGHAERQIGLEHDVARLAVVAGNRRARRFYERCGWVDRGSFDNDAEIGDGATMAVPARRYTKRLTQVDR